MSSTSEEWVGGGGEEDLGRVEKLEKLLRALQDIKRENVRLRSNFVDLQAVHKELRANNEELQEENNVLRSDLVSREAEVSATVEELAQELEQSYKNFEEAKSHILTQTEAKALEERLRTEIEGPFLAKIDQLDGLVHEKIEDCTELWKVQEVLKEELANTTRRLQNDLEVQESRYSALLEEVEETKKLTELFGQDPNEVTRAKNELEVQCLSLEQQQKSLLDEVKQEREARLRADAEVQKEVKALNEARAEWWESESRLKSKNDTLHRQCEHLQEEMRKTKERDAELHKELLQAQKDLSKQKSELEAFSVQREAERTLDESNVLKLKSNLERDKRTLENSMASQEKRLALLTTQHMKEIKDLQDEHKEYVGKLEAANARLKLSGIENDAKDRASMMETQKRLSQLQMELDSGVEKIVTLERTNALLKEENSVLKDKVDSAEETARKLQTEVIRCKKENSAILQDLEKQTDKCLRSSSEAERLEREKKKLEHEFDQVEDRLRSCRRSYEDQIKVKEAELEDSRRNFALERATTTKRHEEAQQSAIKTYLNANANLKRKLGKAEENSSRLEREYTLLLIKVAELEAERKELRMQLNFGLSDLSAGTLGLSSNIRTLASDIMRETDDSAADDDVALALAAVGA
ncbi:hypothetical protein HOP50_02g18130 [Chloropicon primus]|uniref:Uncharacterized protein n=1 Tax=Chloropicon primus TaxID=1764295 RepID=A0A5B8MF81_9CHLO|nr:hypothetical protein A3770_02p18160 [Chloropicon primus]UPQ98507.1 hypothetical protein HOP50_02g18130 [Chloropicon primus]|eukprot:QDZ19298.1 hypothetical protein A3770_02p18160 [Chloropicon primus]